MESNLLGFEIKDGVLVGYTGDETKLFIPEEVIEIAPLAFFKQESIVTVLIKNNVKKIGEQAFFCCPNLTEVAIDDGVEVIEDDLFFGCEALKRVVFGKGTKLIKAGVFNECPNIEVVGMMGKAADWAAVKKEEGWDDNLGLYGVCTTEDNRLVFPKGIPDGCEEILSEEEQKQREEEKKAKAEAEEAKKKENAGKATSWRVFFYIFTLLALGFLIATIVTIVSGTELTTRYFRIHPGSLLWKLAITIGSIVLAELCSVKENKLLEEDWYKGSLVMHLIMAGVIAVTIASGVYCLRKDYDVYQDGVFYNTQGSECVAIDSIREDLPSELVLPSNLISIKALAFRKAKTLRSVTIPDSVIRIERTAFEECSNLSSINIPSSVTSIGAWAFCDCTSLTSITIPSGVKMIEYDTFCRCTGLSEVTIPKSVTSIQGAAFYGCTALKAIYYDGTVSQWNGINKDRNWRENAGKYTVYCSDGTASR